MDPSTPSTDQQPTVSAPAQQQQPVMQPAQPTAPVGAAPSDYLIWSIVTLVLVSLPFGVAALIFSMQSKTAREAGNYDLAAHKAKTAKTLNVIGLAVAIVSILLIVIIIALSSVN